MKKLILSIVIIGSSLIATPVFSQGQIKDSLGLPGDNFNLYAVLDMFQQCKTLEEFEGKINGSDSKINNLDLNGDNKIDYIKVIDNGQGTMHAIVLKDEINAHEMQDVAVIEVDKVEGKIKIQVVGDEQLYGKNYIVEPKDQSPAATSTPNPGYSGQSSGGTTVINNTTNNYYNNDDYYRDNTISDPYYGGRPVAYVPVDNWYMWEYLYAPTYSFYVSPFGWGFYPTYWNPWQPMYYHEYYGYHYQQYGYYHRTEVYVAPAANAYYGQRRTSSTYVSHRTQQGAYASTYGRRDLLNRSVNQRRTVNENRANENRSRRVNENGNQNREQNRNNGSRENENRPRNENNVNQNRPRNENNVQHENQPRNENNVHEDRPRNENNVQHENQPRNENNVNQNRPRNENNVQHENQPRNDVRETPRNENRVNKPEGNNNNRNNTAPKPANRPESKPAPKPAPRPASKEEPRSERK